MSEPRPTTLGELRASGWTSVPVRQELRRNAVGRIRSGQPLFDDVLGYQNTVIPQIENALLAGHDMIMLGERGQAKTRMIRGLVGLLDEWLPIIAGSEINDDPYAPVSAQARALVADHGDDTPVAWTHRDDRYGEKLATPDTSIADLIGEVDPIKVAEGRYLSDELTVHYGLVPRTNRGIFAINELPDLAERIQVGLLNVLEERDVQIRGYKVRLPLDVVLVASANPEDYTNRGRIITPLKDRFGAQIRTHYPLDAETEIAIVEQEAYPALARTRAGADPTDTESDPAGAATAMGATDTAGAATAMGATDPAGLATAMGATDTAGLAVTVPAFMTRIVVAITRAARSSSHVSQRSGVSVRLSISNHETLVANATRRILRAGSDHVVPRVTDLDSLTSSTAGKVEIETLEEGREPEILQRMVDSAVLSVFKDSVPPGLHRAVVDAFDEDLVVDVGDDVADADYAALLAQVPALTAPVQALLADDEATESPAMVASAVELVLEGLHLSKRLNKDAQGFRAQYRSR